MPMSASKSFYESRTRTFEFEYLVCFGPKEKNHKRYIFIMQQFSADVTIHYENKSTKLV